MKQETLEEAAENNWNKINAQYKNGLNPYAHKIGFIEGYKLAQGKMYSEKEVYHILCEHTAELFKGSKLTLTQWFEQFKKK